MTRALRGLAATLVVASIAGGCAVHPMTGGPVRLGLTSGTICLPANPAGSYTMGFDLLHNEGRQPVKLVGVHAVGGSGITVAESYLVPVPTGPWTVVGVQAWPPKDVPPNWGSRTPALGPHRLDPSDHSVEGWNLVLHLTATGPAATYDHLVVDYSVQGIVYEAANEIGVEIKKPCL